LASTADPETGAYTLRRWKVTKIASAGGTLEVALQPDNKSFQPLVITSADRDVRVVAEYLETVG